MLIFGERIANEILEDVNHKHYVFSIHKIIRPYFKYDRTLLGKLCRCGYDTVTAFYREVVLDETAVPGAVLIYQTFGSDAANYHCHVHGLIQNLLTWKNSGFCVYSEGKVVANDDDGRERLAKYMIRSPISIQRLTYDREKQIVYYRTDETTLTFEPVEFLARLSVHVPNIYEQTVRYMGYYSNKSRGMRKRAGFSEAEIEIMEQDEKESRFKNYAWARLIKKVYEISPLVCKQCGGEMKIISVITDCHVIRKILKHIGMWNQRIEAPNQAEWSFKLRMIFCLLFAHHHCKKQ